MMRKFHMKFYTNVEPRDDLSTDCLIFDIPMTLNWDKLNDSYQRNNNYKSLTCQSIAVFHDSNENFGDSKFIFLYY